MPGATRIQRRGGSDHRQRKRRASSRGGMFAGNGAASVRAGLTGPSRTGGRQFEEAHRQPACRRRRDGVVSRSPAVSGQAAQARTVRRAAAIDTCGPSDRTRLSRRTRDRRPAVAERTCRHGRRAWIKRRSGIVRSAPRHGAVGWPASRARGRDQRRRPPVWDRRGGGLPPGLSPARCRRRSAAPAISPCSLR